MEKEIENFIKTITPIMQAGNSELAIKTALEKELKLFYSNAFIDGQTDVLNKNTLKEFPN